MAYEDFYKLQTEVEDWSNRNFPTSPNYHPLLGIMEEVGELSHSFLKKEQGIRMDEDHDEKIRDAVADILIFLCDFCNRNKLDLASIIGGVWEDVKSRDWNKHREEHNV